MRMCLRQFARPKISIRNKGCGNCMTCMPHNDNVNCLEYYPIDVTIVFAEEDDRDLISSSSIFNEDLPDEVA